MNLSEKYLEKLDVIDSTIPIKDRIMLYGRICSIEARKTCLVENQSRLPNDYYIAELQKVVNELQEIAEQEKL